MPKFIQEPLVFPNAPNMDVKGHILLAPSKSVSKAKLWIHGLSKLKDNIEIMIKIPYFDKNLKIPAQP